MAASKRRQAEIPAVHVCIQCDCAHVCVCDVCFLMDKPTAAPEEVHLKSSPWQYLYAGIAKGKKTCSNDF